MTKELLSLRNWYFARRNSKVVLCGDSSGIPRRVTAVLSVDLKLRVAECEDALYDLIGQAIKHDCKKIRANGGWQLWRFGKPVGRISRKGSNHYLAYEGEVYVGGVYPSFSSVWKALAYADYLYYRRPGPRRNSMIASTADLQVGDKVHYTNGGGDVYNGIVKTLRPEVTDAAWVVFHVPDNDWDNYKTYTAAMTALCLLNKGWL